MFEFWVLGASLILCVPLWWWIEVRRMRSGVREMEHRFPKEAPRQAFGVSVQPNAQDKEE